jgi:hypothetical protein
MNAISFRRGYRMHYQSNVLSPAQFAMPDEARLRWERNYVAGFTERLANITIEFWRDVPLGRIVTNCEPTIFVTANDCVEATVLGVTSNGLGAFPHNLGEVQKLLAA